MKCKMMVNLRGRCKGGRAKIGEHSGNAIPEQHACARWNFCKGDVRIGSILYGKFHKNTRIWRKQQRMLAQCG